MQYSTHNNNKGCYNHMRKDNRNYCEDHRRINSCYDTTSCAGRYSGYETVSDRNRQTCDTDYAMNNRQDCHYQSQDYGPEPYAIDLHEAALENDTFRTALWTGEHLQLTIMSLKPGEDIGLEIHPCLDQFVRIEKGKGVVIMGKCREQMDFRIQLCEGDAFIIPAGTWHNFINTDCNPLKLSSIYGPPSHPHGTVHRTKKEAEEEER